MQNGYVWMFAETWELLVSLFWLCYAGELLCRATAARGGAAADVEAPRGEGGGELFPIRPAVSCLVLAGSAGLMTFAHFDVRAVPLMPDVTRSATPVNPAGFAVHFTGERLVYFKETCELDPHAGDFFVYIIPKDKADLPERRRKSGFDILYFHFASQGVLNQGDCYASISLPNYPITSIRTGQQGAKGPLWEVELLPPE